MPKSLKKQLEDKAAQEKLAAEKKVLDERAAAEKTEAELEAEKIAAEKKAQEEKKDINKPVTSKEELKKKFPKLDDEQIAVMLELETPEEKKAPVDTPPVKKELTAEIEAKLQLLDSILSDEDKAPLFEALKEGKLLESLTKYLPKGEDYSTLKPRELVEKALILDGATKEEIENELKEFDEASYYKKKDIASKSLESLKGKNKSNLPDEYVADLKKQAAKDKAANTVIAQREAAADKVLTETVTSLIGQKIDGVEITKENSKELISAIVSSTPRVQSPQGGFDLDVRTGIERGKRLFAYDKVIPAKDKRIKILETLVKELTVREEARVRPALNYTGTYRNGQEVRQPLERESVRTIKNNPFLP